MAREFGLGIRDASMYAVGSAIINYWALMLCDSMVEICALNMFEVIKCAISQSDAFIFIIWSTFSLLANLSANYFAFISLCSSSIISIDSCFNSGYISISSSRVKFFIISSAP